MNTKIDDTRASASLRAMCAIVVTLGIVVGGMLALYALVNTSEEFFIGLRVLAGIGWGVALFASIGSWASQSVWFRRVDFIAAPTAIMILLFGRHPIQPGDLPFVAVLLTLCVVGWSAAVFAVDSGWRLFRGKKVQIKPGQTVLSIILVALMGLLPCLQAKGSDAAAPAPKVTATSVLIPLDGNGHVLLDKAAKALPQDMPAEIKANILEMLAKASAMTNGQTLVSSGSELEAAFNYGNLATSEAGKQLKKQIASAVAQAQASAEAKLKTLVATGSSGTLGSPTPLVVLEGLAFVIVVIIAIALIASFLYLIYLLVRYIMPNKTNVVGPNVTSSSTLNMTNSIQIIDGKPTMLFTANSGPNSKSLGTSVQGSSDLAAGSSGTWNTALSANVSEMKFDQGGLTATATLTYSTPDLTNQTMTVSVPVQRGNDTNVEPSLVASILVNYSGPPPNFFKSSATQ